MYLDKVPSVLHLYEKQVTHDTSVCNMVTMVTM